MEEKIKISIPFSTYDILIKDCENFLFYKNDKNSNKNYFLNTLIMNYYEKFSASEDSFHDSLMVAMAKIDEKVKYEVFENVLKVITKRDNLKQNDDTTIISFKPTKISEKAIDYILNVLVKNESISSYFRRMFNSYAHNPQNEREKIIFKDNYDLLIKSINKDVNVCLTLKSGEIYKDVSIYYVGSSKEELYNYALFVPSNTLTQKTVRLAKIKNVLLLSKKRNLNIEIQKVFDRQIKNGIQYPIFLHEIETIQIKLTEKGKKMYKRIFLYRPNYEKIDGDIYYFNCSFFQILHYFKRFGEDALIISPINLARQMKEYYYLANSKYQKQHNK